MNPALIFSSEAQKTKKRSCLLYGACFSSSSADGSDLSPRIALCIDVAPCVELPDGNDDDDDDDDGDDDHDDDGL